MSIDDNSYVKHTLRERCFYRRRGDDNTITSDIPKEVLLKFQICLV